MKVILKHIIKNMLEKKLRTFIMITTVLLATMIMFIGLSLNQVLQDTYAKMTQGTFGTGNILIENEHPEDAPLDLDEEILTADASIQNRLDQSYMHGLAHVQDERIETTFIAMDLKKAEQMALIDPIQQQTATDLMNNQVMISERTADQYDVHIGDTITVMIEDEQQSVTIGAISQTTGVYYGETDAFILVMAPSEEVIGSEHGPIWTQTLLQVEEGQHADTMTALSEQLTDFSVSDPTQQMNVRDEETFQTTLFFAIVIIVFMSAYVILSLAKLIVAERIPVIGTFRSLGIRKVKINVILICEFLFYGVLGALIGIGLGILLLPMIADALNEYKSMGVETTVHYQPLNVLIAIIFGMFFPAIISLYHVLIVGKKTLKELIFQSADVSPKRSLFPIYSGMGLLIGSFILYFLNRTDDLVLGFLSVLCLFIAIVLLIPIVLTLLSKVGTKILTHTTRGERHLGIKNIANNKTVANNCSMVIIVFLLLLMVGMTSTGIDHYLKTSLSQDYDLLVTGLPDDTDIQQRFDHINDISNYHAQSIGLANYNINGNVDSFSVLGVDNIEEVAQFYDGITFVDQAIDRLQDLPNGVIIDEYQANRYELDVGDTFNLQALDQQFQPIASEAPAEVVVAGIMDSASLAQNRETVIVHHPFFMEHFTNDFGRIAIKVKDHANIETVKSEIMSTYFDSNVTVQTFSEMVEAQKGTIDTLMIGITIIIFLGFIVGLLGITNNLIVSFFQRKKEYAILHSVCMSKRQLMQMIVYEMLATFVTVVLIGCVGGMALNIVMTKMLYGIGLRLEFSFHIGLYVVLCCAVLLLLALSILPIINKIKHMNILRELRYE